MHILNQLWFDIKVDQKCLIFSLIVRIEKLLNVGCCDCARNIYWSRNDKLLVCSILDSETLAEICFNNVIYEPARIKPMVPYFLVRGRRKFQVFVLAVT